MKKDPAFTPSPTIQVIERMFSLIDVLASREEAISLKEISERTGLHPSTTHRILNDSLHWSCTHEWIKAMLGQISSEILSEACVHFLLMQLLFKLHQELINHAQDNALIQCLEAHDGI